MGWSNILVAVVASSLLVFITWNLGIALKQMGASQRMVTNYHNFKEVTTVTVVAMCLLWVIGQPIPEVLETSIEWFIIFLPDIIVDQYYAVFLTSIGVWWAWSFRVQGDEIVERFVARKYNEQFAPIAENIWDVAVIIVFALLMLDLWGISVAALLAPAGIVGITLGFAARETIANFFGSLSLYADETYETGDYIELENGFSGIVRDISVRSTTLQTLDGNLVNVPNSELNKSKITNKSSPTQNRRIQTTIGVGYGEDIDRVTDILTDSAKKVSDTREPKVCLSSFGDSSIEFDIYIWVQETELIETTDRLNREIYNGLAKNNIEIPFPQRELTIQRS